MGLIHKSQTAINETKKVFQNYKQRKQEKSPLKNKFYIPGFPKCGSSSLEKYLKDKGFDIIREESIYRNSLGIPKYKLQYPNYQTLFVMREPIQRIWSHYNYKRYYQKGDRNEIFCSFEEALEKHPEIVDPSDYEKWLKKWQSTKPVIVKLEDLIKINDFPMINTTEKNLISNEQKQLIIHACKKLGFDPANYEQFQHTSVESFLNSY